MKVCIYCRVSTDKQELEQQIAACKRFCDYRGFEVGAVYSEIVSGAKAKRPQYLKMVQDLRNYKYDGVVVFRLDRLGRNSREILFLVDELANKGIDLFSVHENLDTTTAIGRAMRDILIILAQLERDQIADATRQRLAALKAQGKKLGRPKAASEGQVKKILQLANGGKSPHQIAKQVRLSYGTVWNIVKKGGAYCELNLQAN